jgi:Cytochrome C biogenesis protein transmembrane region
MSTLPLPIAAFAAGFVSFLTPCVLPLIPGYISLISGVGLDELRQSGGRVFREDAGREDAGREDAGREDAGRTKWKMREDAGRTKWEDAGRTKWEDAGRGRCGTGRCGTDEITPN